MAVQIGNTILFEKDRYCYEGTVLKTYDNSVLVKVEKGNMDKLNLPNNITIVNHKHYKILN